MSDTNVHLIFIFIIILDLIEGIGYVVWLNLKYLIQPIILWDPNFMTPLELLLKII
jgi:hypothetical protein